MYRPFSALKNSLSPGDKLLCLMNVTILLKLSVYLAFNEKSWLNRYNRIFLCCDIVQKILGNFTFLCPILFDQPQFYNSFCRSRLILRTLISTQLKNDYTDVSLEIQSVSEKALDIQLLGAGVLRFLGYQKKGLFLTPCILKIKSKKGTKRDIKVLHLVQNKSLQFALMAQACHIEIVLTSKRGHDSACISLII